MVKKRIVMARRLAVLMEQDEDCTFRKFIREDIIRSSKSFQSISDKGQSNKIFSLQVHNNRRSPRIENLCIRKKILIVGNQRKALWIRLRYKPRPCLLHDKRYLHRWIRIPQRRWKCFDTCWKSGSLALAKRTVFSRCTKDWLVVGKWSASEEIFSRNKVWCIENVKRFVPDL